MSLLSWILDLAAIVVPPLLGYIGWILRKIDNSLSRLELHDRVLFGEERLEDDAGLVQKVEELQQRLDRD
jgi:hypothetical protein